MRFGDDIMHITHVGWHAFDGRRWREDKSGAITRRHAHATAKAIFDEVNILAASPSEQDIIDAGRVAEDCLVAPFDARNAPPAEFAQNTANRKVWNSAVKKAEEIKERLADRRKSRYRHAKSSCGSSKLNNMLQEAAAYRAADVSDLNRDFYAVNVDNGTLRFSRIEDQESDPDDPRFSWSVTLDQHNRDNLISKLAPVAFDEKAPRAKSWEKFLSRVQPSPAMRSYLQRLAGYSLLGLNSEQMIAFFYGIGRNGKSTFVDCLCRLLGDYAVTLSIDSFAGDDRRGGGEATPDLARLPGARLCAASEPESGVRMKEALIKRLTGGETVAVRRLHQDFFEFDPQFTLIVSGNHKPVIIGNDDGIWRRIHLVPWNEQIAKDEVDKDLPRKLDAEAPGILKWMVEGAIEYLNCGELLPPQVIIDATQEYREEEDPIGSFIRHACEVTGNTDDIEKPFDLYSAYERYALASGIIKLKDNIFNRRLPDAARRTWTSPDGGTVQRFFKAKTMGLIVFRGIRIREEWLPKDAGGQARNGN